MTTTTANVETIAQLERLLELSRAFEETTIGQALRLIVALADGATRLPTERREGVAPVDDRLLSPAEASKYLAISWPTLRDVWVERYDIKFLGDGRGKRFRVSELQRVIRQREAEAGR